jgi:hypothetical protein
VLIGTQHPLIDTLVTAKKFDRAGLLPGQGLIRVVRKAFGDKSAILVTGADDVGLQRALSQMAERLPHLWPRGKDRPTIDDVEDEARRFVSGRTPAGQAAMGLYKLDRLTRSLAGKDLESATVRLFVEKPAPGLADYVKRAVSPAINVSRLNVEVEALDVTAAKPVVVSRHPVGGGRLLDCLPHACAARREEEGRRRD